MDGYTVFALRPATNTSDLVVEYTAALSEEDALARATALAPAPPVLLHRQPGATQVGAGAARRCGLVLPHWRQQLWQGCA